MDRSGPMKYSVTCTLTFRLPTRELQLLYLAKHVTEDHAGHHLINACEMVVVICLALYFAFINLATVGLMGSFGVLTLVASVWPVIQVRGIQTHAEILPALVLEANRVLAPHRRHKSASGR